MIKGIKCPECLKENLYKSGFAISGRKKVQRYTCNICYRTTVKPVKEVAETMPVKTLVPAQERDFETPLS
jgi:transposase-like protein